MLGGEGMSSAPLVVFSRMLANEFRGSCSYTLNFQILTQSDSVYKGSVVLKVFMSLLGLFNFVLKFRTTNITLMT